MFCPGAEKLTLYRYLNPIDGPRTMPTLDWAVGKAAISTNAQLKVDLKEQTLALVENGGPAVDVGLQLVYVYE